MRIAAIGDLHAKEHADPGYRDMFAEMSEAADAIVICGDLTDSGSPGEAGRLAEDLAGAKVPVLAVLGNHDHQSGQVPEVKRILSEAGLIILEDQAYEIGETGFVGTKGFGGGFGRYMLSDFGEEAIKQFAEESVREALKLERDLQNMRLHNKIVVLHYAPALSTVHGEPPELYPFLGSSRLGEVIQRFDVHAVMHGHAHAGTFEGAFPGGPRIYNCSQDVLKHYLKKSYAIIDVPGEAGV